MISKINKIRIIEYSLVLITLISYATYTLVSNERVLQLNRTIADSHVIGDCAFPKIAIPLHGLDVGKEIDVVEFRKGIALFTETQNELIIKIEALSLPEGDDASQLQRACIEYLNHNIKLAGAYTELADYVELHNPVPKNEVDSLKKQTDSIRRESGPMLIELVRLQKKFATKHGIGNPS